MAKLIKTLGEMDTLQPLYGIAYYDGNDNHGVFVQFDANDNHEGPIGFSAEDLEELINEDADDATTDYIVEQINAVMLLDTGNPFILIGDETFEIAIEAADE